MGDRTWTYLIDDEGVPHRLSQRIVAAMREHEGLMPEHASQRRKIIVVRLRARGRHLPLMQSAAGRYWTFDASGSILEGLAREKRDIVDTFHGAQGKVAAGVIDAQHDFMMRRVSSKHFWTPSDSDMEPIVRDIWGMSLSEWRSMTLEAPPPSD